MMEKLTLLVTVVLALSVASERLVEIIKGLFKTLDQKNPDPRLEGYRRSALQAMAVVSAMLTAFLASDYIPQELGNAIGSKTWTVIGLGLLASGGSGFWNAILTYVGKVKDAKTAEADIKKVTADVTKRNPGRAPLPNSGELGIEEGKSAFDEAGFPIPFARAWGRSSRANIR